MPFRITRDLQRFKILEYWNNEQEICFNALENICFVNNIVGDEKKEFWESVNALVNVKINLEVLSNA